MGHALPAGASRCAFSSSALAAIAIGIPVARLGGSSASICTLGFLVIVHVVLVASSDFTRGSQTFFGIPRAVNLWVALPFAVLAVAIARIYRDSAAGMKLRASREDDIASTAVGVNVRLHRFLAWVLGQCFPARPACCSPISSALSRRRISISTSPSCFSPC
ncbi:branched-chain amino acid ABC transporter permease [Brucella anthropi]|uniref:branched-chain amino acid ABC transporter permease n=1 Tax=Brucella anthropi TaxID=529 RepID=UPI000E06E141|nr:branched-chain amino acid ABC transporter permease [Brucella anthropi]SUB55883.1 leucine/isoleucine/valine transporter permease subunit [Brucella anthropi]